MKGKSPCCLSACFPVVCWPSLACRSHVVYPLCALHSAPVASCCVLMCLPSPLNHETLRARTTYPYSFPDSASNTLRHTQSASLQVLCLLLDRNDCGKSFPSNHVVCVCVSMSKVPFSLRAQPDRSPPCSIMTLSSLMTSAVILFLNKVTF